jgi:hypothetical protein
MELHKKMEVQFIRELLLDTFERNNSNIVAIVKRAILTGDSFSKLYKIRWNTPAVVAFKIKLNGSDLLISIELRQEDSCHKILETDESIFDDWYESISNAAEKIVEILYKEEAQNERTF